MCYMMLTVSRAETFDVLCLLVEKAMWTACAV
jgi:hypothetical protein